MDQLIHSSDLISFGLIVVFGLIGVFLMSAFNRVLKQSVGINSNPRKEVITMKKPEVGDHVIYTDKNGNDQNALVQVGWSEPCCNVVFVSSDKDKQDRYGRQIEHETSVSHASGPGIAHGRYWRWPGEEKRAYKPPESV
jgi:hypothetical protein